MTLLLPLLDFFFFLLLLHMDGRALSGKFPSAAVKRFAVAGAGQGGVGAWQDTGRTGQRTNTVGRGLRADCLSSPQDFL